MTYHFLIAPFVRAYRYSRRRCVVCGDRVVSILHPDRHYWYCTISCGCYDGTMSVRYGPRRNAPKPSIWRGYTEKRGTVEENYL